MKVIKPWELALNQEAYNSFGTLNKIASFKDILGVESYAYVTYIQKDRSRFGNADCFSQSVEGVKALLKETTFLDEPLFINESDALEYRRVVDEMVKHLADGQRQTNDSRISEAAIHLFKTPTGN